MARACWLLLLPALCAGPAAPPNVKFRVGSIQADALRECSGIVASRKHDGVFWAMNDGGNPAILYALTREGRLIREYPVAAKNTDWEDLAIDDDGHLYIADVGNNLGNRKQLQVLRVKEPDPHEPIRAQPVPLRVTSFWRLDYPAAPFDCESLFVLEGKGYLIPKRLNASSAEIFRFDLAPSQRAITLERIVELPKIRAPVTAADVSSDGKRLAILTVLGPYLLEIDGDVQNAAKAAPRSSRYIDPTMEAACFVKEGLLVTNEGREIFLFRDEHFSP